MKHFFALVVTLLTAGSAFGQVKVGLVLDKGGRDDKSFNASAFRGATEAETKLKISLKVVEASDDTAIEPSLRTFAQRGFDLVIGIGFVMGTPMKKVAAEFPKVSFLLIDSEVDAPNIKSVIFKEHEGSYLVGAIAALTSKSNAIGFIGGMDIPLIRRFEQGYRAGAEAVKPKVKVSTNYVGSTSDSWKNPMKAKELALSQYQSGVDVIFQAAGASGAGLFDAAEEKKKFAIGVDSNQNWVKPGRILTSMVKHIDRTVYDCIDAKVKGQFTPGRTSLGLKEDAVGFAVDTNNRAVLTPEIEKKANELREQIVRGKIKVPDFYETQKAKKS